MEITDKLGKYLASPEYRFGINNYLGFYRRMPDEQFVKLMFKRKMGYELNLESPKTFNEKIQWIKLYDRKPQYTIMADKVKAKDYVASIIGSSHIIPTLGVWEDPKQICFDNLPNQFVLKCNHNSGLGMCICDDKSAVDVKSVIKGLQKGLKQDYYLYGREWSYKDIPRRVLAEKYMTDESKTELKDYKFFCFSGECKCFKIDFDRFINHRANYFDREKKLMTLGEVVYPPDFNRRLIIPDTIDEMIEYAEILSKDIPFLRVDFYDVCGQIYFGELTFYPFSGIGPFIDEKWDDILGEWLELKNNG